MHINSTRLREPRQSRQWSQEQLAKLSGLNMRTIQRLESGAKASTESLRALAAVFEVPAGSLLVDAAASTQAAASQAALQAMWDGALRGLDYTGRTTRTEFWWFALAVVILLAAAEVLGEVAGPLPLQLVSLIVLLPWTAACTRRLRDAGLNPWWQLISLAPVGGLFVLLYFLTCPIQEIPDNSTN